VTRAFVIPNADAGSGRPDGFDELLTTRLALYNYALYETIDKRPIEDKVRKAIEQEFDLVPAAWGDGTLSNVAAGVVETGVPLGVIPAGTSNSLADALRYEEPEQRLQWHTGTDSGMGASSRPAAYHDHMQAIEVEKRLRRYSVSGGAAAGMVSGGWE
jgi:hypothetical protein